MTRIAEAGHDRGSEIAVLVTISLGFNGRLEGQSRFGFG